MNPAAIRLQDLVFGYRRGADMLRIPDFVVARGERVFLHGPSGCGKTTLLGLIAGVLTPRSGGVEVLGHPLHRMGGAARDRFRGAHLGYVFQLFNLLPYLSVVENVVLPCRLHPERRSRLGGADLSHAATTLAGRLGIAALLNRPVLELSVGQQQRVAAARALLGDPGLIIADEPTSALDAGHRAAFLDVLFDCCGETKTTLLYVSHDRSLEGRFDRSVSLPSLNQCAASL